GVAELIARDDLEAVLGALDDVAREVHRRFVPRVDVPAGVDAVDLPELRVLVLFDLEQDAGLVFGQLEPLGARLALLFGLRGRAPEAEAAGLGVHRLVLLQPRAILFFVRDQPRRAADL